MRLSASILIESGVAMEDIKSLADLVEPERFKIILRHYHERANRKPNAFVICLAKTLIQVAQYHVGATPEEVGQLKRFASKLPAVPFDLTAKNKASAVQFESDHLRAKLLFLPEQLMAEVAQDSRTRPAPLRGGSGGHRDRHRPGHSAQASKSELSQLAAPLQ